MQYLVFRAHHQARQDNHPIQVCNILKTVCDDEEILQASILHDTIEDTETTYEQLRSEFGERVADLVAEVTKDKEGNFHIRSKDGLMIKLADMLHNISDSNDQEYILKKIKFVEKYT